MEKFKHSAVLVSGIFLVFLTVSTYAVSPKVTKTIPENGEQTVDSGLRQIRIEFDQDMSHGGLSICGGGPKYPKTTGKAKWINKRTLTIPVKLRPGQEYELSVNCQSYRNFKNLQGESAIIYPIKFKTTTAGKKSGTTTKSPSLLLQEGRYAEETEGDLEKAIGLYEQVLEQYKDVKRISAIATYQLGMCHLKKGEKDRAAEYFQTVLSKYPSQKILAKKADEQLEKLGGRKIAERNLFEFLGNDVCAYLGSKYGEVCAEAGMKRMYSNSHIYFVDSDFVLRDGGMGYIYNMTGLPITQKHRLGGTSYPNQKLYDVVGNEMDVEIVPDELREGFYHIYWTPKEPLGNGEFFNYGWAYDGSKQLSSFRGGANYSLTMQNHFGSPAYETFFLVVPEDITVADKSEEYTKMKNFQGYDIYWWKKEVQAETNHRVDVVLKKEYTIIADELPIAELRSNDESATKEHIKSALGQPDKETEKYLDYKNKYGLSFFVDGYLKEIHIEPSFKGHFTHGITMNSTTEDIFEIFGEPVETIQTDDLRKERKHKVLYRRSDGIGRISYDNGFFAFWLKGDKINQIVVSSGILKGSKAEVSESAEVDKLASENLAVEGWQLWGQRELVEAEAKFKEAISKNPDNENAYQGLGWAQLNQGKKLNARDSFEKCIKLNPKNSAALNGLGWISHGQGNIDEAIRWWEKAIEAQPGATASLNGLTKVYMEKKEYDKAIKYYEMWLKAEPNNDQAKKGLEKAQAADNKAFEVASRIDADNKKVDKTDYPFVKDTKAIGKWGTVDFIKTIGQFQPGQKQYPDELFLKELVFERQGNGKMVALKNPDGMFFKWTNGLVLSKQRQTASRYIIKNIDGKNYMFFEWKSGDYTIRHSEPSYYVLKRLSFGERSKAEKAAVRSAMLWLGLIDKGDYNRSWEKAAGLFKNNVTKAQWNTSLQGLRTPLGKLISRQTQTKTYTTSLPGAPDGEYVVITFSTSFENKASATETVTPMLEDGRWRVSGYFIK